MGATVAASMLGVSLLGEKPKGRKTFSMPGKFSELQVEQRKKKGWGGPAMR